MSIEKINKVDFSADDIRDFSKKKYGTIKNLADAMGISSPHLHAYLSGKREFGASFKMKLHEVGFFEYLLPSETPEEASKQSLLNKGQMSMEKNELNIDIDGAIELSNTPAPRLAQLMGVSPATLDTWRTGASTPTLEQLVNLFNLTVALGLSARHAPPKPLDTAETTDEPAAPMPPAQATA